MFCKWKYKNYFKNYNLNAGQFRVALGLFLIEIQSFGTLLLRLPRILGLAEQTLVKEFAFTQRIAVVAVAVGAHIVRLGLHLGKLELVQMIHHLVVATVEIGLALTGGLVELGVRRTSKVGHHLLVGVGKSAQIIFATIRVLGQVEAVAVLTQIFVDFLFLLLFALDKIGKVAGLQSRVKYKSVRTVKELNIGVFTLGEQTHSILGTITLIVGIFI